MEKFNLAITGGTFDRLHKGHEKLLKTAFEMAREVCVGITSDAMAGKKTYPRNMEPLHMRISRLRKFLKKNGFQNRAQVAVLDNVYGPRALDEKTQAIIVTRETVGGAVLINNARRLAGKKPARVITCPLVLARNGKHISSTAIRLGQMDGEGRIYLEDERIRQNSLMPESLVRELRKPFGKLFIQSGNSRHSSVRVALDYAKRRNAPAIAAVGDASYESLKRLGTKIDVAVLDGKIMRKKVGFPKLSGEVIKASNPPGTVTKDLVKACVQASRIISFNNGPCFVIVEGEEDLAAIPLLLSLPLESALFYGMPGKGIVCAIANEETKTAVADLFSKFKVTKS